MIYLLTRRVHRQMNELKIIIQFETKRVELLQYMYASNDEELITSSNGNVPLRNFSILDRTILTCNRTVLRTTQKVLEGVSNVQRVLQSQ